MKIVAITGSYRRGGVTEQAAEAVLAGAMRALKSTAEAMGFRAAGSIFIGMASLRNDAAPSPGELKKARALGRRLAGG